jgi:hypothetical protein
MRIRVSLCLLGAAFLAASARSAAAQHQVVGFSYDWSLPVGDLNNFISNDSWIGMMFEGRSMRGDRMSVGAQVGYYAFYTNTSGTITAKQGAISGQQYRHLDAVPLMASFYVHGGQPGGARPYIGLGTGVYYLHQTLDIGVYRYTTDNWIFGVAPEIGILLPYRGYTGTTIHVRYNLPISAGSFLSGEARSLQYLTIGFGFFQRR